MHSYMIVRSLPNAKPNRWFNCWQDRKCFIGVYFARPNGQTHTLGELQSDLGPHDLEHLVWSVGFSIEEEAVTSLMNRMLNKTTLLDLLSTKKARLAYTKYVGYDVKPFFDVLDYIHGWEKGNEIFNFKISCLNGKLVVENLLV